MNYKLKDDGVIDVLAERVEGLCVDMSEMKHGIAKMADALTKLAIVEERQMQTILAQERAFKALERVEERQRQHELQCRDQEKDVRQLIADSNERLSIRVAELEKAEPMQAQTSKWVTGWRVGRTGPAGIVHRAAHP
jgi:transcription initiation factor IIF auxiliary subunit